MMTEYKNIMETGFREADTIKVTELSEWLDSPWKKFFKVGVSLQIYVLVKSVSQ